MEQHTVAPQTEIASQPGEIQPELAQPKQSWLKYGRSPLVVLMVAFVISLGMWVVDFQPVSSDTNKLNVAYEPTVSDADLLNLQSPIWQENRTNNLSQEIDANGQLTHKLSTTIIPLSAQYIAAGWQCPPVKGAGGLQ